MPRVADGTLAPPLPQAGMGFPPIPGVVYNGVHHIQERKAMAQYTASKGVPSPELAVTATGALLLAGGASVLLGVKPKWGTLAIVTFLAGVSPVMHDFWKSDDPARKQNDMAHFMKNMAIDGGSLAFVVFGGGIYSLDAHAIRENLTGNSNSQPAFKGQ